MIADADTLTSMEPDAHWRRVEDVYHRALQCEPSARSAFVAAETGGDVRLAADVESLLHTHALDDGFLETPALESAAAWLDDDAGEPGLDRVGHYRVIELLGAGGMGDVYRAWDEVLERDVALKILRPDGDSLRAAARLRQEGQSAARLSHPNICTVHEVGEQGGKSYLVMELVQGRTLADVLAEAPLTAAQTCRFGAQKSLPPSRMRTNAACFTATSSPQTSSSRATTSRSWTSGSRVASIGPGSTP